MKHDESLCSYSHVHVFMEIKDENISQNVWFGRGDYFTLAIFYWILTIKNISDFLYIHENKIIL